VGGNFLSRAAPLVTVYKERGMAGKKCRIVRAILLNRGTSLVAYLRDPLPVKIFTIE
jgi:hypothetical protein